jgi:hypothetical protein
MNAYELADGLSKMYIETDNHGLFNKRIQNMLRQQADRIHELSNWKINAIRHIAELEDRLSMYEIKDLDRGLDENRK